MLDLIGLMNRQQCGVFRKTMMCDLTSRAQPALLEFFEYFGKYVDFIQETPEMLRYYLYKMEVIQVY